MKRISYNYLFRLISFSLLIGAIPVIALGIYFYSKSTHIIEKNVRQGNEQILLQTQLRVEQMLKTMDATLIQFMTSTPVQTYFADSYDDFEFNYSANLNEVVAGMNRLYSYELGVLDIYLVDGEKGIVIRSNIRNTIEEDLDKDSIDRYYADQRPAFRLIEPGVPDGNYPTAGKIIIVKKIPTKPKGMLVVKIRSPELAEEVAPDGIVGNLAIVDGAGQLIARSHSAEFLSEPVITDIAKRLADGAGGESRFMIEADGRQYEVGFRHSSYTDWYFFTVSFLEDIQMQSRAFGWVVAFVCLSVIAVVAAAALKGSFSMYTPIRKLRERVLDDPILSTADQPAESEIRDDFQLIESRFNSLVSNRMRMEYQVQVQLTQLKEFFVMKLLLGQVNPRDMEEKLKLYGFPAKWKTAGVMALVIDSLEDTRFREQDRDLLMSAINNMAGELVPASERMSPILMDQYQVTVILSDLEQGEAFDGRIRYLAELIRDKVDQYLGVSVSIGISRSYGQLQNTIRAYGEAKDALQYRRQLGENVILSVDDVKLQASPDVVSSRMIAKHLIDTMKSGNLPESQALFDIFMKELRTSGVSLQEIRLQSCQLVSNMMELIQDLPEFGQWCASHDLIGRISLLSDVDEIERLIRSSAIEPIIGMLENQQSRQLTSLSDQMLAIIHQEFACSLTLEVCAARLNFHPRYLGRVFRKKMGVTFSEYLSQYRLDMSKQWLVHTDMKIADIADKLQYNSPAAFIRYFRKAINMTPGEYRKRYQ